jgi:signal transduction histidine kinase
VVVVTDNGSGIPVGVVPRIFEPGFTTKFGLETGGLGLGLSTCRTLLESVGGSIGFQHAEPGPGACFMIRLPWQS